MAKELLENYDAEYLLGAALSIIASDSPQLETAPVEEISPDTAHVELPLGRFQGVHPRRVVEFLTAHTGIRPRQVGDIDIQSNSTLVEIPIAYEDQVYSAFGQFEKSLRSNNRNRLSSKKRWRAGGLTSS